MELKDITYQGFVNLQNCEKEPIHIPGSVQPHGYLLVIDKQQTVRFCSENCQNLNWDVHAILEQPISSFLAEDPLQIINYTLSEKPDYTTGKTTKVTINGQLLNLLVHSADDITILEFEKIEESTIDSSFFNAQTFRFARELANAESLADLCQRVADNVKEIINFDRVMIYRFDKDYNGQVFAENVEEEYESFLGLNYPHTDIPPQARELYLKNLVRTIPDINYKPVAILTRQPDSQHSSLDLSMSVLRSVSPIHIQYLKNMGIGATFTVSIISEGQLWGMIACHNYSAKLVSFEDRIAALLQATLLGSQVKVVAAADSLREVEKLEIEFNTFQKSINNIDLNSQPYSEAVAYSMVNADAFVLRSPVVSIELGTERYQSDIKLILGVLTESKSEFLVTDNMNRDLTHDIVSNFAGLLYYKLGDGTQILWLREELVKEVLWAGDPSKSVEINENGLSPRKSFAAWTETKLGFSRAWKVSELNIAKRGVFTIQNKLAYLTSKVVQMEQSKMMEQLIRTNAELENIWWITSHDLQEPLRKIRMFTSLIEDEEAIVLNNKLNDTIVKISRSAERMHNLLNDLLAINQSRKIKPSGQFADLNIILNNVREIYKEQEMQLEIAPNFPNIIGNVEIIKQLLINIVDNSVKYAHQKRILFVDISFEKISGYLRIIITDNGVGFDMKYADLIFKVFKRVNDNRHINGTGVGLSICKEIVESMNGNIYAKSVINEGTQIIVELPLK